MKFLLGKIKNGYGNDDIDGFYAQLKINQNGIDYDLYDVYLIDFLNMLTSIIYNDNITIGKYWDNEDYGTQNYDNDIPYLKIVKRDKTFIVKIRWVDDNLIVNRDTFVEAYKELISFVSSVNQNIINGIRR